MEQRNTRHQLIGTGILCGLQLQFIQGEYSLSSGIAVTSEGYLLTLESPFQLKYFRKYEDKGQNYRPFKNIPKN